MNDKKPKGKKSSDDGNNTIKRLDDLIERFKSENEALGKLLKALKIKKRQNLK